MPELKGLARTDSSRSTWLIVYQGCYGNVGTLFLAACFQVCFQPHAVLVIYDRSEVSDHSDVKKTTLDAEKGSTRSISSILTLSLNRR